VDCGTASGQSCHASSRNIEHPQRPSENIAQSRGLKPTRREATGAFGLVGSPLRAESIAGSDPENVSHTARHRDAPGSLAVSLGRTTSRVIGSWVGTTTGLHRIHREFRRGNLSQLARHRDALAGTPAATSDVDPHCRRDHSSDRMVISWLVALAATTDGRKERSNNGVP
jgi:hypothetical protein